MKKILFFTLLLTLWTSESFCQGVNWEWARNSFSIGFPSHDEGRALGLDKDDNVYVGGFFQSRGVFIGNLALVNYGGSNAYVAKFDSSGIFDWVLQGKTNFNSFCNDLVIDHSENVIFTGSYSGDTLVFQNDTLFNPGNHEMFLGKLDANGNVQFLFSSTSSGSTCLGLDLAVDSANNIFVTGGFTSTYMVIGADTVFNPVPGCFNAFIAKFDSSGNPLWARAPENPNNCVFGDVVTTDDAGNTYLLGRTDSDTLTFGSYSLLNPGGFLVKYDPFGIVLTATGIGGEIYKGSEITIGQNGSILISGSFDDTLRMGSLALATSYNGYNSFLIKLDSAQTPIWGRTLGGPPPVFLHDHAIDEDGNILVHGSFTNFVELHPLGTGSPGSNLLQSPSNSLMPSYFVKYDSTGRFCDAFALRTGGDDPQKITVGNKNAIYLVGDCGVDSLALGQDTLLLSANEDILVAKFRWDCEQIANAADLEKPPLPVIYPNPGSGLFNVRLNGLNADRYLVRDVLGRTITSAEIQSEQFMIDVRGNGSGLYFVELMAENGALLASRIVVVGE